MFPDVSLIADSMKVRKQSSPAWSKSQRGKSLSMLRSSKDRLMVILVESSTDELPPVRVSMAVALSASF